MNHIYYHKADLDGIGSGIVVANHLLRKGVPMDRIKMHPWDYGMPEPSPEMGSNYYIVDVSFSVSTMLILKENHDGGLIGLTWIDHHKTSYDLAINNNYHNLPGSISDKLPSAVQMCWEYFEPNRNVPPGIVLLSLYDTWQSEHPEWESKILPFQYGMRTYNFGERLQNSLLCVTEFMDIVTDDVDSVLENGEKILAYQDDLNRSTAKRAYKITWKNIDFACINAEGNSKMFDSVPFDYDACLLYRYDGAFKVWRFTLYGCRQVDGVKGKSLIDLSTIARKFGGGGHAGACGFEAKELIEFFDH